MSNDSDVDAAITAAEGEMFGDVLGELYLGVLASRPAEAWFPEAAWELSRGSARVILNALTVAHAAGMRQAPRAAALAEAIDALIVPDRPSAHPHDFPYELGVMVVSRDTLRAVCARVDARIFVSADEVVESALHALAWAEEDEVGKFQLLKYAASRITDPELLPVPEIFRELNACGDGNTGMELDDARAVAARLMPGLPPYLRVRHLAQLAEEFVGFYERAGTDPPPWVRTIQLGSRVTAHANKP
ncbi:MAG TPA: hypothetical protein VFJ16_24475 [Longimicrobium sp.]|nr:hypothetical protein [Longimicrobium sp.]